MSDQHNDQEQRGRHWVWVAFFVAAPPAYLFILGLGQFLWGAGIIGRPTMELLAILAVPLEMYANAEYPGGELIFQFFDWSADVGKGIR